MKLPTIYLDEHIESDVAEPFKSLGFRVIEIKKTYRLKGKDERDFIKKIFSDNGIFVTSDYKFVNEAMDNKTKHFGLVYIPNRMLEDEKVTFAWIAGGYIQGATRSSIQNLKGHLIYPGDNGLYDVTQKKAEMVVSWDWIADNS